MQLYLKKLFFCDRKSRTPTTKANGRLPRLTTQVILCFPFLRWFWSVEETSFFYCISLVQCMKNNLTFVTDYKDDPDLYVFPDLKYVAIELWQVISSRLIYVWHFFFYNYWNISTVQNSFMYQVKSGTLFDNVLICDDPEYAKKFAEETWGKQKDVWMWTSFGLSDQCSVSTRL